MAAKRWPLQGGALRLRLRLLWILIACFFRRRLSILDTNVLRLIVLPNDVDISRLSSDRYLPLMDLGRLCIVFRAGLFSTMVRKKWIPVGRVITIRFRYPLRLFQRFELHSRVIHWDEEWAWTEHHFKRHGRTIAIGISKMTFLSPGGGVAPIADILAAAGEAHPAPAVTPLISHLEEVEELVRSIQS
jgi:acyl-CoA thioesterase FadM